MNNFENNLLKCIIFNLDIFLVNTSVFLFGFRIFILNNKKIKEEISNERIGKPLLITTTYHFEGNLNTPILSVKEVKDNPGRKIFKRNDDGQEIESSSEECISSIKKDYENSFGNTEKKFKDKKREHIYYIVGGLFVICATYISLIKSNDFSYLIKTLTFIIYLFSGYIIFLNLKKYVN